MALTIGKLVALTGANRKTLKKNLQALMQAGHLSQNGSRQGPWYGLTA